MPAPPDNTAPATQEAIARVVEVGARCRCNYRNSGVKILGTVRSVVEYGVVPEDGVDLREYAVEYDDGEIERGVCRSQIQLVDPVTGAVLSGEDDVQRRPCSRMDSCACAGGEGEPGLPRRRCRPRLFAVEMHSSHHPLLSASFGSCEHGYERQ